LSTFVLRLPMKKHLVFFAILLLPIRIFADKAVIEPHPSQEFEPWFTGPLIAPASMIIPPGHYDIEPYIFATAHTAFYDRDWEAQPRTTFWNFSFQPLIEIGVLSFMDFEIIPNISYNLANGSGNWIFGDLDTYLNFQLFSFTDPVWHSSLKFSLAETFPTGKYQNLNPRKNFTDQGGLGSWQTGFWLVWGNQVHVTGHQFFNARLSFAYTYLTSVKIRGINAYGGSIDTNGTIYPGRIFNVDLGIEYSLSQNWAFAVDIIGNWQGRNIFTGVEGPALTGRGLAQTGLGASAQFSLAPAIEYNWSENLGLIAGVWFTVAGREATKFASGVIAVNYYH